jgi:hypothetical protein
MQAIVGLVEVDDENVIAAGDHRPGEQRRDRALAASAFTTYCDLHPDATFVIKCYYSINILFFLTQYHQYLSNIATEALK